jgi:hypothetical protein
MMRYWILIALVLVAGCTTETTTQPTTQPTKEAPTTTASFGCPEDVKVCPDGTDVVRLAPGCEFAACPPTPLKTMDVATDRGVYHSRENMLINLTMESDTGGVAEVYVHGINARNMERLKIRQNHTLEEGTNYLSVNYRTPSCTGCSGISPGDYMITAEVKVGDEIEEKNITVNIQQ